MVNDGLRIALIAKAGDARQQLQTALKDLGADLVCEGDTTDITPQMLLDLKPAVVVVGLEPSIDKSLHAFDEVLNSANFEVVYDDAEVSGQLSGWDLNRWARHLAAKLIGSDLMPPVPAGTPQLDEALELSPGAPESPAQQMADANLADYLVATPAMAIDVPTSTDFSDALGRETGALSMEESKPELQIDFDDLEKAMNHQPIEAAIQSQSTELLQAADSVANIENDFIDASTASASELNSVDDMGAFANFDFVGLEESNDAVDDLAISNIDVTENNLAPDESAFDLSLDDDSIFGPDLSTLETKAQTDFSAENSNLDTEEDLSTMADFEVSEEAVSFSNFNTSDDDASQFSVDDDVAALAAQLEANEDVHVSAAKSEVKDLDFTDFDQERASTSSATASDAISTNAVKANEKPSFDFSSLELVDSDAVIPAAQVKLASSDAVLINKVNFELEQTDEEKAAELDAAAVEANKPVIAFANTSASATTMKPVSDTGAVLILAGMGGPDAVRQLLKALPNNFNAPVLLYQHLEVGNHDRLVTQLEKISLLPVYLASVGRTVAAGQVAVLPAGVGLDFVGDQLQFGSADSQQDLVATMPPAHSAVVLLSGASLEAAQAAAYLQAGGGLALAQDPANCFEPAAASALIAKGGKTAEIADIAKMLVAHFTH
jgi:chemosensory pili system protein ChpB (putative protein-glutamate methylesterase)